MRNYIAYAFLSLVIVGNLIGIINIFLGRYTSFFVKYSTIAPIESSQLNDLSKEEQSKFKYLVLLNGFIDIVISISIILVLPKATTEMILFLSSLFYVNSILFRKYMSRVFKLRY